MSTKVERSIEVHVPVRTAYDQWTQFEDFPHFMGGVKEVQQKGDQRLHWVAEIAGVRREWDAAVLEQVPDQKIAWAATSGATNAGAVRFEPAGAGSTLVFLTLEYEPEGLVEQVGDKLGIVGRQVDADLERFKALVEDKGYASGAWRGSVAPGIDVGTPGVEDAQTSRGDSGKAGLSGKAVVAGAAAAVAGVAAAMASRKSDEEEAVVGTAAVPPPVTVTETVVVEEPVTPVVADPVTGAVADPVTGVVDDPGAVGPVDDAPGGRRPPV
ncbi:MAG: Cyclase/dehydrase [Modestobacter sp.]|jgi:carbon monoxide dehydrogenase subunit G|nr:Cyclase/dehydrase [Modestobacter sp.]